ncbi:DUF2271 domain-containing protein [Shewanella eurypsychrophilus]|uniref:DUF2271 domain-containing protein n=1 Tax=Shewanella eurypsychrophilus TaxID=2593656 RepID=A0ABX6V4A3_9GAMM|nr:MULTISPECIES: DUF2271 domain-containing protein [Shewanella]QFU22195.1 DUF2271 domain-containing protein [Shewanella sp. YLB-09]QPG57481.1 DUF2271 domain-containing protein [Shewanella eurypsychrophilus]
MKLTQRLLITLFIFGFITVVSAKPIPTKKEKRLSVEIALTQFTSFSEKPYLALWYSEENKTNTPLLVLRADSKWLRDLKSFWRYIARYQREKLDGVTSATVKSGAHQFTFELPHNALSKKYRYWLEVVRENGDRELLNISIAPNTEHVNSHLIEKNCVQGKQEIDSFCVSYQ